MRTDGEDGMFMAAAKMRYEAWLADPAIDEATKRELRANRGTAGGIEDRFYRDLEFGTGGLRGVMGAGTNRMNVYTIGKATQGWPVRLRMRRRRPAAGGGHRARFAPRFAGFALERRWCWRPTA